MEKTNSNRAWTITEWLKELPGKKPAYHKIHNWLQKGYLRGEKRMQGESPYWVVLVPPTQENIPAVRRGRKTPTGKL